MPSVCKRKSSLSLSSSNLLVYPHFGEAEAERETETETASSCAVIQTLEGGIPMVDCRSGLSVRQMLIRSGKLYTLGRCPRSCNLLFHDPRVSRQHCQLYLHPSTNTLFVVDGVVRQTQTQTQSGGNDVLALDFAAKVSGSGSGSDELSLVKCVAAPSLNGVFVNGNALKCGHARALSIGDEVSLVCAVNSLGPALGFVFHHRKTGGARVCLRRCIHGQNERHRDQLRAAPSKKLRHHHHHHHISLCVPTKLQIVQQGLQVSPSSANYEHSHTENAIAILADPASGLHFNIDALKISDREELRRNSTTRESPACATDMDGRVGESSIASKLKEVGGIADCFFQKRRNMENLKECLFRSVNDAEVERLISRASFLLRQCTKLRVNELTQTESKINLEKKIEDNVRVCSMLEDGGNNRLISEVCVPVSGINGIAMGDNIHLTKGEMTESFKNGLSPEKTRRQSFHDRTVQSYQAGLKNLVMSSDPAMQNGCIADHAVIEDSTGFFNPASHNGPVCELGAHHMAIQDIVKEAVSIESHNFSPSNERAINIEAWHPIGEKTVIEHCIQSDGILNFIEGHKAQDVLDETDRINFVTTNELLPPVSSGKQSDKQDSENQVMDQHQCGSFEKSDITKNSTIHLSILNSFKNKNENQYEQELCTKHNKALEHVTFDRVFFDGKSGEESGVKVLHENLEGQEKFVMSSSDLSPGSTFYLNRLQGIEHATDKNAKTVSLRDLVAPTENLLSIFCATFTLDIEWFLSYCRIPKSIPVTIACHSAKRCWSKDPEHRWSKPYSNRPNLTVIHPPFPEESCIGKDRSRGIGCHHPKLILVQHKDFMRIIISSANLSPVQWLHVSNTVWWQDFPHQNVQDYAPLFSHAMYSESSNYVRGDFASQLAGFLSSLLVGVPMETHWIGKLAHYNFKTAAVSLVTSIPGVHEISSELPEISGGAQCGLLSSTDGKLCNPDFIGAVTTSVVGISYRFCDAADPKSELLKKLARLLMNFKGNSKMTIPVFMKRVGNIPADPNAVSVIVYDINSCSDDLLSQDSSASQCCRNMPDANYVALGFLPKDVAKWVAPLWDAKLFMFRGFLFPKEALATAAGRTNNKVKLIMCIFKGENFSQLSTSSIFSKHNVSICCLLSFLERRYGLWRLQEVLSAYKWPDNLETDFLYGSSSIGTSLDAKFLAAFAAASGKRSISFNSSEESDPEWGCWDAHHEWENPSIKIIFPTIRHVKSTSEGIFAYSRLLCFSESTWERLKSTNVWYDAIPYPSERNNWPMHVKIARRRFQDSAAESSFGWIYCGSHNFSPAAWGRPLQSPSDKQGATNAGSVLGSKLHVYNYEIGVVFIVSPPKTNLHNAHKTKDLDEFTLPFVVPPPPYLGFDRPATKKAICEAKTELLKNFQMEDLNIPEDLELDESSLEEELPNEDLCMDFCDGGSQQKKENDHVYAEELWSQLDASSS